MIESEGGHREDHPLANGVKLCLNFFGYPYAVESIDPTDIRFKVRTASTLARQARILVYEDSGTIRLFVLLSGDGYPARRRMWVRELVARLNQMVAVFGYFVVDWSDGSVYYVCGIDLRHDPFPPDRIQRCLNAIAFPLSIWERSFRHVTRSEVAPLNAVEAALLENECFEGDSIGDGTRRALLSLVEGNPTVPLESEARSGSTHPAPLRLI